METIRVYARQRLSGLDDPDRVRRRHLDFLVARAHIGLTGGQPQPWMARLAADLDDLRAAMDWVAQSGDLQGLVDLIEPIGRRRGSRWDQSIGEWLLGVLAHGQGCHDEARGHLEASRSVSTDPRLPFPLGRSLLGLAELAKEDQDPENAWKMAHDGLEILDAYGDRVGAAAALETIADLAVALGEPEGSLRLLAASQRSTPRPESPAFLPCRPLQSCPRGRSGRHGPDPSGRLLGRRERVAAR